MLTVSSNAQRNIDTLSRLLFQSYHSDFEAPLAELGSIGPELDYVCSLSEQELSRFQKTANTHHVLIRALRVLEEAAKQTGKERIADWCYEALARETVRVAHAVQFLDQVCKALESAGCKTAVIKSLDHWPDIGSDLDLFTTSHAPQVIGILRDKFQAELEPRSWGDRLANKWNFRIPGLPELIEIHVRYLGQTGEHKELAQRVIERRVPKIINGVRFLVPAPEERIAISTLQRMYRHFYFRLCDMVDVAALLQANAISFPELRKSADTGGIWPGVATFLLLVMQYANSHGGNLQVPSEIIRAAYAPNIHLFLQGGFLRVPKLPAARLYGSQLVTAGLHRDLRALWRLPLLPPLAVSALFAYRITGSDKGVW